MDCEHNSRNFDACETVKHEILHELRNATLVELRNIEIHKCVHCFGAGGRAAAGGVLPLVPVCATFGSRPAFGSQSFNIQQVAFVGSRCTRK